MEADETRKKTPKLKSKVDRKTLTHITQKLRTMLGCCRCGEKDYVCLHFHHIDPSKKRFSISNAALIQSAEEVLQELQKCCILCANCHMKEHCHHTFSLVSAPIPEEIKEAIIEAYTSYIPPSRLRGYDLLALPPPAPKVKKPKPEKPPKTKKKVRDRGILKDAIVNIQKNNGCCICHNRQCNLSIYKVPKSEDGSIAPIQLDNSPSIQVFLRRIIWSAILCDNCYLECVLNKVNNLPRPLLTDDILGVIYKYFNTRMPILSDL